MKGYGRRKRSGKMAGGTMFQQINNPGKCGWYGHPSGRCRYSPYEVRRYQNRVSGQLLDRIDISVEVPALEYDKIRRKAPTESSAAILERVNAARAVQRERIPDDSTMCNAKGTPTVRPL